LLNGYVAPGIAQEILITKLYLDQSGIKDLYDAN